MKYAVFRVKQS